MALANTVGDRSLLLPPKIRSTFRKKTAHFFIVLNYGEQAPNSFFIADVLRRTNQVKRQIETKTFPQNKFSCGVKA